MEREADVLQQRIEAHPLRSRRRQAFEGVRAQKQESIETQGYNTLRGERCIHRALGQAAFHQRD